MTAKSSTTIGQFEKSLQQLEKIVEKMESGDLSLEKSLAAFEDGIALTKSCQTALAQAEQKIQLLVAETEALEEIEFEDEEDN